MTIAIEIFAILLSVWILSACFFIWKTVPKPNKIWTSDRPHIHTFDSAVGSIEFYNGATFLQCKCGAMGRAYPDGYWGTV